jgi:hypothetical protein
MQIEADLVGKNISLKNDKSEIITFSVLPDLGR